MEEKNLVTVVLGGGCFWCIEATFLHCKGVKEVLSGYAGGKLPDPSYEMVCSGMTGHVEVVKLKFDPTEISYEDILHIFFAVHDPTKIDRQGNDVGTQYRSVIFYNSPEQKERTEKVIAELNSEKIFSGPIVTQISALEKFYPAESDHQNYYQRNPEQAYCQVVIEPKIAKFRAKYQQFYQE